MKGLSSIALLCFIIIAIVWFYRGYKIGKSDFSREKERILHDKIVYTDKPVGNKIKYLIFASGEKYQPLDFEFNTLVMPGDSIVKASGSLRYVIYKAASNDSIIYNSMNTFYK